MDRTEILRTVQKTPADLERAGIDWNVLDAIREHFEGDRSRLEKLRASLVESLGAIPHVHSIRGRVKDGGHVVQKCIRKQCVDPTRQFTVQNYQQSLTDLIGVRVLHLYKGQWDEIHAAIKANWRPHEQPKAYVRRGDAPEVLEAYRRAELAVTEHEAGYRSLHYLVYVDMPMFGNGVAEIQVRTIFEEGWSEVDHELRYPHGCDPALVEHLRIFNRIAGSADEMASSLATLGQDLQARRQDADAKTADLNETIASLTKQVSELNTDKARRESLQGLIDSIASAVGKLGGGFVAGAASVFGQLAERQLSDANRTRDARAEAIVVEPAPADERSEPPQTNPRERTKASRAARTKRD